MAHRLEGAACKDCVFYDAHPKIQMSVCRRNPPSIARGLKWPEVWELDWCGEFEAQYAQTVEL